MSESAATQPATQQRGDFQGEALGRSRVVYEFDIPESLQSEEMTETLGMVKLNGREEKAASKRSRGDGTQLAYELVKASLYEVDGRRVKRGEHEDEKLWNNMDPILRNLMLSAYAELHTPEDDVTENFIKGRREKVG